MKGEILFLVLIAVFLFGMSTQSQAASTPAYLGQTTWTMYITIDTVDPFMVGTSVTLTGGLTKMGGNYYSFQGSILDWGDNPQVLSGGGTIINGKLILTLSVSYPVPSPTGDRGMGVMNVSLDTAANNYLNGNFTEVGTGCLNNANFGNFLDVGTMTRTGNAIPLSAAYNAPQSLLLLQ